MYWHPPGAMVRHLIESFWKELHLQRGYQLVYSPHIAKVCVRGVLGGCFGGVGGGWGGGWGPDLKT